MNYKSKFGFGCMRLPLTDENDPTSINQELFREYDDKLAESGYNTFWKELTTNEKQLCIAIANSTDGQVDEIQKKSRMKISNFNNYRARLIRKEIISASGYGKLTFTLPRFKEYVLMAEQFGY